MHVVVDYDRRGFFGLLLGASKARKEVGDALRNARDDSSTTRLVPGDHAVWLRVLGYPQTLVSGRRCEPLGASGCKIGKRPEFWNGLRSSETGCTERIWSL